MSVVMMILMRIDNTVGNDDITGTHVVGKMMMISIIVVMFLVFMLTPLLWSSSWFWCGLRDCGHGADGGFVVLVVVVVSVVVFVVAVLIVLVVMVMVVVVVGVVVVVLSW